MIVVIVSLTPAEFLRLPEGRLSLRWYEELLRSEDFLKAFLRSLALAALSAAGSVVLGTLTALALVRYRFRGGTVLETLCMAPLIVPQVVIGLALLQFFSKFGMAQSFTGLVLSHVILCFPFVLRIVGASLKGFNVNLEHAARTLGASWFAAHRHVVYPLIRPGVLVAAAFAFITSFDNLTVSLFLAGPYQVTLPIQMYLHIDYSNDPLIASVSTALIGLAVVFVVLFEKLGGLRKVF
ncbi:MAG: ABC transporter permease [Burkholderiales bacterium]|nr:ABC transporter permease [Burkholderiales bacterium]